MTEYRSPSADRIPIIPALIFFGGLTLILVAILSARPNVIPPQIAASATANAVANAPTSAPPTTAPTAAASATPQTGAQAAALDPARVKAGEQVFQTTCSACHGFNAKGIPGLGKDLVDSPFVDSQSDDQLLAFIIKGRPVGDPANTTGVAMPPRGGNASLTDDKLMDVVQYIRSIHQPASGAAANAQPTQAVAGAMTAPTSAPTTAPTQVAAQPTTAPTEGTPQPTATVDKNVGRNLFSNPGQADYVQNCSGCHGVNGEGVANIAGPLANSKLFQSKDGIGLFNFLTKAEPPKNPAEGFNHPYRGGYPPLDDSAIRGVIAYLYSLPGK